MKISIDIETTGQSVIKNSMISFGAYAFDLDSDFNVIEYGRYEANLRERPGTVRSRSTMRWWLDFPEAWEYATLNARDPDVVMPEFLEWLRQWKRPTCVGYPIAWDFSFIHGYLYEYTGSVPFSHCGECIKTLVAQVVGKEFREVRSSDIPESVRKGNAHTHRAIDDAIEQAHIYAWARKELVWNSRM